MTDTAELRAPQTPTLPDAEDGYKRLMLAALRVARAKLRLILLEIDDIGIELKDGRLTAGEALVRCDYAGISPLFPGEGDGG